MNVADMLGALARRWYILVAGLLIAAFAAYGTWTIVKVEYTRTSTQLMLPGPGTIPDDANPFLYVGGLSQVADVLVRKMGSPEVLADVLRVHPDAEITVTRDAASSGPVVLTTVTSESDEDAAAAIDELIVVTESALRDLQAEESIPRRDRITLVTLTVDDEGQVEQRGRMVAAGLAGVGTVALSLLLVALIDGLARSRAQRRGRSKPKRTSHRGVGDSADDEFVLTPPLIADDKPDRDLADVEDDVAGVVAEPVAAQKKPRRPKPRAKPEPRGAAPGPAAEQPVDQKHAVRS